MIDLSIINRATKEGFLKYMLLNPHYFKILFRKEATKENIKKEFDDLKRSGLVAAKSVRAICSDNCPHCRRGVAAHG